jgi:uncharacterized protein (DUF488 family)
MFCQVRSMLLGRRPTPGQSWVVPSPGLVSVGYEGRTVDELIAALLFEGVEIVADVRLTPLSRKAGLSKTGLTAHLNGVGIGYVHFRGLGNPKDNRAPFRDGRVDAGVARFRELLMAADPIADLDRLTALAESSRVAVLCFERAHAQCHRQVVADEVVRRSAVVSTIAMV